MISIVCHGGSFYERKLFNPLDIELEEVKIEEKRFYDAGIMNTASSLSLATVLTFLNQRMTSDEFLKPAMEWFHAKLLKKIGLLDVNSNVVILTSDMLMDSDFFKSALDMQNFKEVVGHGMNSKSSEVDELNRKFLARFYHADGTCALLPEHGKAVGIPMTFPYELNDLLDLTVPFGSTENEIGQDREEKNEDVAIDANTEARPGALRLVDIILEQHGQRLETKVVVKPPGIPKAPAPGSRDLDEPFNRDIGHVEVPIVQEPEECDPVSTYGRIRQCFEYLYLFFVGIASSLSSAGENFSGSGGSAPPKRPSGEVDIEKRARRVAQRRPRAPPRPDGPSWCFTCCEFFTLTIFLLILYVFIEVVGENNRKDHY